MDKKVEAKVALVIGAGDSTGGAIARRFAAGGYTACVTRRDADKLQPLIESIRAAGGQAHGYASDARKEDEVIDYCESIGFILVTPEFSDNGPDHDSHFARV